MNWEVQLFRIVSSSTFQRCMAAVLATLAECLIEHHRRDSWSRRHEGDPYGRSPLGGLRHPGEENWR